ncbi:MAG: TonB family protein [Hyphomonas sp.]
MVGRAVIVMALSAALLVPPMLAQGGNLPDMDARPVRPPIPVYPQGAAAASLSGYCDVRFSVDTRGRTSNIRPYCSHPEFCASATAAMEEVRFMPARRDGMIVARDNVVYPLEYRIYGGPEPVFDLNNLTDCVDPFVS